MIYLTMHVEESVAISPLLFVSIYITIIITCLFVNEYVKYSDIIHELIPVREWLEITSNC